MTKNPSSFLGSVLVQNRSPTKNKENQSARTSECEIFKSRSNVSNVGGKVKNSSKREIFPSSRLAFSFELARGSHLKVHRVRSRTSQAHGRAFRIRTLIWKFHTPMIYEKADRALIIIVCCTRTLERKIYFQINQNSIIIYVTNGSIFVRQYWSTVSL